jgi:hypothetical protein
MDWRVAGFWTLCAAGAVGAFYSWADTQPSPLPPAVPVREEALAFDCSVPGLRAAWDDDGDYSMEVRYPLTADECRELGPFVASRLTSLIGR